MVVSILYLVFDELDLIEKSLDLVHLLGDLLLLLRECHLVVMNNLLQLLINLLDHRLRIRYQGLSLLCDLLLYFLIIFSDGNNLFF